MTFTYSVTAADWGRIAPELVLIIMALVVMLVDLLLPKTGPNVRESGPTTYLVLPLVSILGLVGAFVATIILFGVGDGQQAFNHMIGSDQGSLYAYIIILSASILGVLLSPAYLKRLKLVHQGEYYALFLLATLGMMLLAAATSFLTVFLGLEMLSLALYILCGFVARRKSSQESGMKYFLLSSFASAFLLYGIALTYGATGSTAFSTINFSLIEHGGRGSTLLLIAMGLLAVGFAFKISAIPFQAWTPDVYEGAPAPVTAFMSVGTKAAAIIAFARVFAYMLAPVKADWLPIVETITILTIVGGNVLALVQTNTKRLLAYSSIAHAGYLMIGIVSVSYVIPRFHPPLGVPFAGYTGMAAILFYLLCYTFMNLGAFGIVSILERPDNTGSDIKDLRGLWYRRPVLAGTLAFFMLALAGFPPMAGFAAKYYIFYAAIIGGHPELLIIGVLASVLGMYYYLRIIASMFMEKEPVAATASEARGAMNTSLPSDDAKRRSDSSVSDGTRNWAPTSATAARRIPATPRTGTGRGAMNVAPTSATAVAVKTPTVGQPKVATVVEQSVEQEQRSDLNWLSWVSIGIAVVGTLAMGTVLPFWLVALANSAAQTMLR